MNDESLVSVTVPTNAAVDLVQLRLMALASELNVCAESASPPSSTKVECVVAELLMLAGILRKVEKGGNQ